MSKVVRIHTLNGIDGLKIDDVDVPPADAGEVRIKVAAIGLNRADTMAMGGGFGEIPLPSKFGYEAAGIIESVGDGVTDWSPGDRVAVLPGVQLNHGVCGELSTVPANMIVKTPDGQTDVEAAASWMPYLTAYAVRAYRPIAKGDAVVITAASSSVGLAALQIVRTEGGIPIAVTRGRGKVDSLKQHGAAHVIVSDEEDVGARIQEITGGQGAALVFDAVGGVAFQGLLMSLRIGGMAIIYGGLAGDPESFYGTALAFRDLTIRGFATNYLVGDPSLRAEAVSFVQDRIASGEFKPAIDKIFPLQDVIEAYRHLLGNQQIGKILLSV